MGDVPNDAFVIKATPNAVTNREIRRYKYRFIILFGDIKSLILVICGHQ